MARKAFQRPRNPLLGATLFEIVVQRRHVKIRWRVIDRGVSWI